MIHSAEGAHGSAFNHLLKIVILHRSGNCLPQGFGSSLGQRAQGLGNSLLIAAGDAKRAAQMMMLGMIINAILDPAMIFGFGFIPAMGIKGAAWATVFSQSIAAITVLSLVKVKHKLIRWERSRCAGCLPHGRRSSVLRFLLPSEC